MKQLKELFIPYELALIAKEKGFEENLLYKFYYKGNPNSRLYNASEIEYFENKLNAPLYQEITDWFRDTHQIFIDIQTDCTSYPKFAFEINVFTGNPKDLTEKEWGWENKKDFDWFLYRTYYEALNSAIKEAFKLI